MTSPGATCQTPFRSMPGVPSTRSCAGPLPVQVDLVPEHEPGLDLIRLGAVDGIGGPARPALALRTVVGEPLRTVVRTANINRMPVGVEQHIHDPLPDGRVVLAAVQRTVPPPHPA